MVDPWRDVALISGSNNVVYEISNMFLNHDEM